jgi:phospholipase/carboxylesterase
MSELKFYETSDVENPKYLVVFLHGYGANGENLLDLSFEFKRVLPDAHFISPNGLQSWEGGFPHCYQWFSLYGGIERKNLAAIADDIKKSNQVLQNFISKQLKRFNLTHDKLFIVGFSQGAMMSIYQGLIAPEKAAGIIGFSGRVILPENMGEKIITKPDICLIHGVADDVVPINNFFEGQELLKMQNINFEAHSFENLQHTIDIHGIRAAQNFVKKTLAK